MSQCLRKQPSAPKVALVAVFILLNASLSAGTLNIKVTNIRPGLGGYILFALYNNENGFLERRSVVASLRVKVEKKFLEGIYRNLPSGLYSVAIFHDADDSKSLNQFLGIPTEGYGFSRIHRRILRKPSFQETSLKIPSQRTATIVIPIHYLHSNTG